jgi:phage terminase large subunit-like protein
MTLVDDRWTAAPDWWDSPAECPPPEWFLTPVGPPPRVEVDLAALGYPEGLGALLGEDEFLLDALSALEPRGPRPWRAKARDEQLPPEGDWLYWLLCAGRGYGKSFVGSNTLVEWAVAEPGDYAAVGPTFADARKIMTEGETGLLAALGDDLRQYHRGDFILHLRNGSRIILASADAPDRVRGLNLRGAWLDELASFSKSRELWDLVLLPALRKGRFPRTVVTTTPRRGSPVLVELLERGAANDSRVALTRGSTWDNAENLSDAFLAAMRDKYEGTSAGQQELEGILLEDVEGALWSTAMIEYTRLRVDQVPPLWRVAVGVDPAVTNKEDSDHTGIVTVGIGPAPVGWRPPEGTTISTDAPHIYVLSDVSLKAHPMGWARAALTESDEWAADVLVGEVNQGYDLVETTLLMVAEAEGLPTPYIEPVTASVGKKARAAPVSGLWQQGRGHFVGGLPALEVECTGWAEHETKKSPDRLDAMVWATVELMPELGIKSGTKARLLAGDKGVGSDAGVLGLG